MQPGYSQQGFMLSLGLHISVAVVVAVLAWTKPFERKHEQVFELIPLGSPGPVVETPENGEVDFDLADAPEPRPAPPRPQSPPPQERQTPPRPAPPTPRAQVTPAPAPPRKAPAPKPKAAPPKQVSYEEFVQQHGKPQTRAPRTSAPPRRRAAAPRIDTKFTTSVSSSSRTAGSARGSPDAERTDVTLYLASLFDAIERAWEKPEGVERTVAVDIDIAPNGRISNIRVSKSSGDAAYDQSAMAAVRAVGSIGPTPGGQTLLRTVRFNMQAK